jgi:hypothetical protein
MTTPGPFTAEEIAALPPRIYTSEVCRLARYGVKKLWKARKAGTMPAPVDRGHEAIFDRDAVLKALGMVKDATPADTAADPWNVNPDAIRQARARQVRHAPGAKGRDVSRVLSGPRQTAALRLVVGDPASDRG